MKDTVGAILIVVAWVFFFHPSVIGERTRAVVDAFYGEETQ